MSDLPQRAADPADIDWILSTARSVRRRLDFERPVARATLLDCIDVAVQAPVGAGGECWRFLIVDEADRKRAVADIYRQVLDGLQAQGLIQPKPTQRALADRLQDMPALVFVCVDGAPPPPTLHGQVAFYGSVLPAAWSLMLTLRARGIGSTWTSLLSSRQRQVATALDIPEHVTQTVMLPVAYCRDARMRPARRLGARQVTYCNRWGQAPEA